MELATFGAGCFWGVEETFRKVKGVTATRVGYMGGTVENPSYEMVCTGRTGHAEVIQVEYDPAQISYEKLLDKFWEIHDPTTLNRQGLDVGKQYRSVIFYHTPDQKHIAELSKQKRQQSLKQKIVTEIVPVGDFYFAEDYHQRYIEKKQRSS